MTIATPRRIGYASLVTAKSVIGIDSPNYRRRTSATTGAFFMPVYGDVRGTPQGVPAAFGAGLSTRVRHRPTIDSVAGDSSNRRSHSMTIPTTRRARAKAHSKMAMSALWRNSSAKCRLERYNHHMAICPPPGRQGGGEMSEHNPETLDWEMIGRASMQERAHITMEKTLAENPDLDPRRRDPEEHARRVAERQERIRRLVRRSMYLALDQNPKLAAAFGRRENDGGAA